MEITLEKIELVKDRTGVTYAEAKAALEEADGSVVNAGIVGVVIAPLASVVAVVAAFGFKCTIEVMKDDGTIIDVSDAVTDAMGTVVEKSSTVVDEVKEKSSQIYQKGKEKAEEAMSRMKKDTEEFDFSESFEENDSDVEIKAEDEDVDSIDVEKSASDTAEDPTADTKTEGESAEESLKQEEEK